ncbi:NRDE family protein [Pseudohaliea sp.]|uniref:NRDE family protein n=1 Tax=Pseudohaliea sp. TaxID=2740289 RepID=UPI0032ED095A
MCLVLLALGARPGLPLVVAANRDEFHARPSAAAHRWPGAAGVVAGRDLEAGGTWLGVGAGGRFAAVTNVSEVPSPGTFRSRGDLVPGFLAGGEGALAYAEQIEGDAYRGFNLVLWDGEALVYTSNRHPPRELGPGVHALANGELDEARFKVSRSREALAETLATTPDAGLADALFAPLADRSLPPEPEQRIIAGMTEEEIAALAAPFIVGERYGTRASTVVLVGEGAVALEERRFAAGGVRAGSSSLRWDRS